MVVVMFTYVLVVTYTKTLEYRLLNHTFLKESFYWDTQGCYYKKELAVMYIDDEWKRRKIFVDFSKI